MGTHPIFESDFDCLTEAITFEDGEGELLTWKELGLKEGKVSDQERKIEEN